MNDTTREVGGALGIALLGTLLAKGYRSSISDTTDDFPGLDGELVEVVEDGIGGAFLAAERLGAPELVEPARQAFTDGMGLAFMTAAVISVIAAAIIALRYPARGHEPAPMVDEPLAAG